MIRPRSPTILLRSGIPTPRSFITGYVQQTMLELASSAVVVKPHRGAYGEGVSIHRSFDALPQSYAKGGYFAQELKESGGFDLKVYVVGDLPLLKLIMTLAVSHPAVCP